MKEVYITGGVQTIAAWCHQKYNQKYEQQRQQNIVHINEQKCLLL